MIEVRLGTRYAKSILELAQTKGIEKEVKDDFQAIENVCSSNPDFVKMLKSPLIFPDKKERVIFQIFGDKFTEITTSLIKIIIRKKREPWLRDIAIRFLQLYDEQKNITRGTLTSAIPLSEAQHDKIRLLVEKEMDTTFVLEEKIDESLIGGFVLRVGDRLFDASVSSGLRKLRQEFDKNPYVKV